MEEHGIPLAEALHMVGEGWACLLEAYYRIKRPETIVTQVKEKFGSLRIYVDSETHAGWDLLNALENLSLEICEVCGEPGSPRMGSWTHTLCDEHAKEE